MGSGSGGKQVAPMICNCCQGTGWLNVEQLPDDIDGHDAEQVQRWVDDATQDHDVAICECCGDGQGWYGTPGHHYGADDPPGPDGPYRSNGGLCRCH